MIDLSTPSISSLPLTEREREKQKSIGCENSCESLISCQSSVITIGLRLTVQKISRMIS